MPREHVSNSGATRTKNGLDALRSRRFELWREKSKNDTCKARTCDLLCTSDFSPVRQARYQLRQGTFDVFTSPLHIPFIVGDTAAMHM